jgi:hypothetical protein
LPYTRASTLSDVDSAKSTPEQLLAELVPITITLPQPLNGVAPGLSFRWASDFVGPLPTGSQINVELLEAPPGENGYFTYEQPTAANSGTVNLMMGDQLFVADNAWPHDGDQVLLRLRLEQPGHVVVDAGDLATTWHESAGLGVQGNAAIAQAQGGGFTAADRATIQVTQAWAALDTFITSLILEDMGTAPPGGQLAAQLPEWRYGIIVRLTQIPADLTPTGPDQDYWVKTLASVRIFRGTDILHRIPIHRSSQIIPFEGNGMILQFPAVAVDLWAPGLTVEVDFLAGVAGQAFLMRLP